MNDLEEIRKKNHVDVEVIGKLSKVQSSTRKQSFEIFLVLIIVGKWFENNNIYGERNYSNDFWFFAKSICK